MQAETTMALDTPPCKISSELNRVVPCYMVVKVDARYPTTQPPLYKKIVVILDVDVGYTDLWKTSEPLVILLVKRALQIQMGFDEKDVWCGGVDGSYMLSQKRARVLGFSWLRRCLNQRWIVRTFQSSCLDKPSNLFSSGCWETTADRTGIRAASRVDVVQRPSQDAKQSHFRPAGKKANADSQSVMFLWILI